MARKKVQKKFDYALDYEALDLRREPELYRVGRGEQGVLRVEPYKSEILPHWRFKTPEAAQASVKKILGLFRAYKKHADFVGMDMARKFLQMGYTRSRRYANHRSGKKYDGPVPKNLRGVSGSHGREVLPLSPDPVKARSAEIFKAAWEKVETTRAIVNKKQSGKKSLAKIS